MITLDGSELAEKAVPYAVEFAAKLGSEVDIVNVRMPSENPDKPEYRSYINKITARIEQEIHESYVLKPGSKVKIGTNIIGGSGVFTHAGEQIVDYAAKSNIGLIILATHGRTGIRRWALGSTANKVARAAACPVLLVRAGAASPPAVNLHKILVPLDGSQESEAVLAHILWLAPKLKSRVVLLNIVEPLFHVYMSPETAGYFGGGGMIRVPYSAEEMKPAQDVAETYIKKVNDKLISDGIESSYEVRIDLPAEAIIAAEKETGAGMVIMTAYGRSGPARWEYGSVADKVIHRGTLPLLLIKP
jgi:nucleotide-binding universal stress UspA family protein